MPDPVHRHFVQDNVPRLLSAADGVIVASSLKRNGNIQNPIDPIRVSQFVEAV
ncbi:BtpA/SgcQ family protein, partial [Halomonas sp. SIMBA_159]